MRFAVLILVSAFALPLYANAIAHDLSSSNFSQDWSNGGLITTNDDWSGVPSIEGYRGDALNSSTNTDPQTITASDFGGVVDVNANQSNPDGFSTGGVSEFDGITDPSVGLQGSGTADAPYILVYLNTTGRTNIQVSYNVRDLDGSADDAAQQVALHYLVGALGSSSTFTNIASAYIADATTGGSATQVTPVSLTLPSACDNQSVVILRIMTTNASGSDEWVGIDDISVTSSAQGSGASLTASKSALSLGTTTQGTAGTPDSYDLTGSSLTGDVTVTAPTDCEVSISGASGSYLDSQTVTPAAGAISQTVHVRIKSTAAVGSVSGNVQNSGGGATQVDLSVSGTVNSANPLPVISGISPEFGNATGGQTITIDGTDFTGATGVTFGGTPATNLSISATQITCDLPAGAGNGQVDVAVTTPNGTDTATNAFTYMANRLSVGDAWVIAYRSDADDGCTFVPWVDLNAGEIFGFTDDSWDGSAFRGSENVMLWQVPAGGLTAGTTVVFSWPNGSATASDGTVLSGQLDGTSASGDQIFVFQGDKTDLVFGINFANSGWITTGTASSNNSYLPAALNVTDGSLEATSTDDNAEYSGTRSGTSFTALKALIGNFSNWTFDNAGTTLATLDGTDFTIVANSAPTITAPSSATVNEDNTFTFNAGGADEISVGDANSDPLDVTLGVTNGTLTLAGTTGLTVSGNASGSITISGGSVANINAALDGLQYTPSGNYNGGDTLAISASDGAASLVTGGVTITVNAVNDPPVNSVPGAQNAAFGGQLTLTTISVSDVDAGSGNIQVTLGVTAGTVSATALGSAAVTGSGTTSMIIGGTLTDVNATLANGVVFDAPSAAGAVTLTVTSDDLGNTGGGAQTDVDTVTINVSSAPSITVPGSGPSFTAAIGQDSPAQSYSVTGANITGGITVTVGAPFSVSDSATGTFSTTLNLGNTGGSVFVRYSPTAGTTHTGTITHSASGVGTSPTVSVSGDVFLISTGASLPGGTEGSAYAQTLTTAGGVGPFNWSLANGPSWLSIDSSGNLSGVPGSADVGLNTVDVTATDTQTPQQSVTSQFSINVVAASSNGSSGGGGGDGGSCSASRDGSPWMAALALLALGALLIRRRQA